jgi:dTDP-4-dehydrorhamnose reductase
MRIFLAGASGAIGRPLTAMLVAASHGVTGSTRSTVAAAALEAAGARAAVVDVLEREPLIAAVLASRPDVVIHQVTSLATKAGEALTAAQLAQNAHVRIVGNEKPGRSDDPRWRTQADRPEHRVAVPSRARAAYGG